MIVAIDGIVTPNTTAVTRAVLPTRPGRTLEISHVRGKESLITRAVLARPPEVC